MRLPQTVHNWVSYLGGAVATVVFVVFWVFLAIYLAAGASQPYAGLILFILTPAVFAAFASYQAFSVTESTAFCGQLCHTVMTPEYTAYQNSPHARVGCVGCHVGPGATCMYARNCRAFIK